MSHPDVLDLDRERAVRREAKAESIPLRFGGAVIANLPAELPLDVLAPIKRLNLDFALLFRQALDLTNADTDAAQQRAATELVVDLLISKPSLPTDLLDAVAEMAVALMGEDGYALFLSKRPSALDVAALAKGLFRLYGVSLGEAQTSSESSDSAGTTSTPTYSAGTDSTPEASGDVPAIPGSSESAA